MTPELDALIEAIEKTDPYDMPLTTADLMDQAIAALRAQDAEIAKMREALSNADRAERFVKLVAGQMLAEQARKWSEEEYGDESDPDFEGAYDSFIEQARNILNDRAALGGEA
jgi:Asp-tRNA(Asn)/Glu-tRNA(Gln) amidotransferase A subunit family amidase